MRPSCQEARTSLKHNFLKNIIIRADFGGLAESEIGDCFEQIKEILLHNSYDTFMQKESTQMMFKIFDPEQVVQDGLHVNNVEKHKVYVFGNEKKDRIFQLSNTMAVMMLSPRHYTPFEDYARPFMDIIDILRKKADKLFLLRRFGVRKQNICILLSKLEDVQKYFESEMFSPRGINEYPDSVKSYQCIDCFSNEYCEINLVRQISEGEVDSKQAYQIVLDTDAYLVKREQLNNMLSDYMPYLNKINDLLLENYLQAIKDDLYSKLCQDNFDDSILKGVKSNG